MTYFFIIFGVTMLLLGAYGVVLATFVHIRSGQYGQESPIAYWQILLMLIIAASGPAIVYYGIVDA